MRLALVILALSLFSCSYEKRLKKWCSRCPQKDSTIIVKNDSIIYRDSAVFFTLEGDTITKTLPCPDKPFEIKKNKGGLITTLKSDGKTITANCEADSLRIEIDRIKEIHYKSLEAFKTKIVQEYCKKEHRNKFDGFTFWWFIFTAIITALYLVFKYIRR